MENTRVVSGRTWKHLAAAAAVMMLALALPAAGDTGFCFSPYCGTGRPDPWPTPPLQSNEQMLAAYLGRYDGCPPGVWPCRPGMSAEMFQFNWDALENWCRAGGQSLNMQVGGLVASGAAVPAGARFIGYRAAVAALNAERITDEAEYARRRVELQRATMRGVPAAQAMAAGRDCMATITEATDASFVNHAGGSFNKFWWWEKGPGGLPSNPFILTPGRADLPCGATTTPGSFGYTSYLINTAPCGTKVPALAIDGPEACQRGTSCTFTARATNCTLSTLRWVTSGGGSSTANPASLRWSSNGTKAVSVTSPGCSDVTGRLAVVVSDSPPPPRCGDGRVDPGETCETCESDAGACPPPPPPPPATTLTLGPSTHPFELSATWRTPAGQTGTAKARPLEADTGAFWFFAPTNLELMVKVLNGCGLNGHWWVFSAGLTDVEVELRVSERSTGQLKLYLSRAGAPFQPIQDTSAFPCAATTGAP